MGCNSKLSLLFSVKILKNLNSVVLYFDTNICQNRKLDSGLLKPLYKEVGITF